MRWKRRGRLYDHLFKTPDPEDVPEGKDWKVNLNPNSLEILEAREGRAKLEGMRRVNAKYQFERLGYFSVDKDSAEAGGVQPGGVAEGQWAKEKQKAKK